MTTQRKSMQISFLGCYEDAEKYLHCASEENGVLVDDLLLNIEPDSGGWLVMFRANCRQSDLNQLVRYVDMLTKNTNNDHLHIAQDDDPEGWLMRQYYDEIERFDGDVQWMEHFHSGKGPGPEDY